MAKGEGGVAGGAFEANLLDTWEVRHGVFLIVLGGVWILAMAWGLLIMKITKGACDFEWRGLVSGDRPQDNNNENPTARSPHRLAVQRQQNL
ncbi:hypothetical protein E4T65_25425 [Pseudomonas fluorescens]|uniref:Uncharacterized protein n=1 Tax=Pseudomonas fluorescens TaxID=294 RepID=A0A4Y9TC34_PSEFL|nr:hypothetical protein E4T65_25425 [Pseudomonas fluorescens]